VRSVLLATLLLPRIAAAGELEDLLRVLAEETDLATRTKMNRDYVPGMIRGRLAGESRRDLPPVVAHDRRHAAHHHRHHRRLRLARRTTSFAVAPEWTLRAGVHNLLDDDVTYLMADPNATAQVGFGSRTFSVAVSRVLR
jgi:hypothetical protein